ncbi:MAG: hypothetical protein AAFR51_11740 [Pseudomonadota bacterium]
MLNQLRRNRLSPTLLSFALAGALTACATAEAQDPGLADRDILVETYVSALNDCDDDKLSSMLHPDHKGFLVRGGVGKGMDGTALAVQCAAGFELLLSATEVTWMQAPEHDTQVVALVLAGTLTHPKRGTNSNSLRVTLTAERAAPDAPLLIKHSHLSALR